MGRAPVAGAEDVGEGCKEQDEAPVGETLPTTGATGLLIAVNRAGTVTLSRVSYGAADSAGVGYRALRVEN